MIERHLCLYMGSSVYLVLLYYVHTFISIAHACVLKTCKLCDVKFFRVYYTALLRIQ